MRDICLVDDNQGWFSLAHGKDKQHTHTLQGTLLTKGRASSQHLTAPAYVYAYALVKKSVFQSA